MKQRKTRTSEVVISPLNFRDDFEAVCGIIATHRNRVTAGINNESLMMVWEVGGFVSSKLKSSAWGDGVVRMLAEYIHTRNPQARGWSYRTIYKMVQLYDLYTSPAFVEMVDHYGLQHYLSIPALGNEQKEFVPIELSQIASTEIVPFKTAQNQASEIMSFEMAQIPSVLYSTGWTNHQIIMNRCRSYEERLFYMLYAGRENCKTRN